MSKYRHTDDDADDFDMNDDGEDLFDAWEDEMVIQKTKEVKEYFSSNPNYVYEKSLGNGANGIAWLCSRAGGAGPQTQKFVMKRAMDEEADAGLETEIQTLELLTGSPHNLQMVTLADLLGSKDFPSGPTLITEYLPNGTLGRLLERLNKRGSTVPNRLLWRVFLCLIKACIALAHPPQWPGNDKLPPEVWPAGTDPTAHICHSDLHIENVVFGELDGSEHDLVPILKVIDFGCADRYDLKDEQQKKEYESLKIDHTNVFSMGCCKTFAGALFEKGSSQITNPKLDSDLAVLVARCLSDEVATQPNLRNMAIGTATAIRVRTEAHYVGRPEETDESIRQLLKAVMFDAETKEVKPATEEAKPETEEAKPESEEVNPASDTVMADSEQGDGLGKSK
ncbi:hypothetical protein PFICI_01242 [Pestalotiopsis fici W106-1]|uniref:Protein kinase domain-containing protein n=1 Tax=Pestalotiopsis fici (strain W106-1 / CGMCC3.15140) TaxID=1229662 RepID=W3XN50_PESFW|nr:uncharacterized protein PFICI_01242 [Pestalotiopsis fici W106-1]ETS87414.1 hypothetical protein PFICI_01242 [Pestalotiopsis fici W106-1]